MSQLLVGCIWSKCNCPVPVEIHACPVGQAGAVLPCFKLNDLFEVFRIVFPWR